MPKMAQVLREHVIGMLTAGMSTRAVARELNVPYADSQCHFREFGSKSNRPHNRRPHIWRCVWASGLLMSTLWTECPHGADYAMPCLCCFIHSMILAWGSNTFVVELISVVLISVSSWYYDGMDYRGMEVWIQTISCLSFNGIKVLFFHCVIGELLRLSEWPLHDQSYYNTRYIHASVQDSHAVYWDLAARFTWKLDLHPCPEDVGRCLQNLARAFWMEMVDGRKPQAVCWIPVLDSHFTFVCFNLIPNLNLVSSRSVILIESKSMKQ
jgi:hypothetical protein